MFKKTLIAAAVTLVGSSVAIADIDYAQPETIAPDPSKYYLDFVWDPTREGGNLSETGQLGKKNKSKTKQTAGGKAKSRTVQIGEWNQSKVTQDASASNSIVYQKGDHNTSTVTFGDAAHSYSTVQQTGDKHTATVSIYGDENGSILIQDGFGQTATATLDGFSNMLHSVQVRDLNEATFVVAGDRNTLDNDQGGWANEITVTVDGNRNGRGPDRLLKTSQWGLYNTGEVTIDGNRNSVLLQQTGGYQNAELTVNGNDNTVYSDQYLAKGSDVIANIGGEGNSLNATQQLGSDETINVDLISSDDNDIYLLQTHGAHNIIDIDFKNTVSTFVAVEQTGISNTATVDSHYGQYDAIKVQQDGFGNDSYSIVK